MNEPSQKTILLVEDEFLIAMNEQMTLERAGYRVVLAGSGDKAIQAVRTNPAIDLILMDIDLGSGMDGTEAARIILQERDLPLVFLSSHTEPEVVEKTEKITAYGYIVKHSGDTVLLASIKMAFKLFEANRRYHDTFNPSFREL
jgi:CheY-like chemotaxis protein